jgi:hypothetical protein
VTTCLSWWILTQMERTEPGCMKMAWANLTSRMATTNSGSSATCIVTHPVELSWLSRLREMIQTILPR